jgi:hypothetical protein
LRIDEEGTAAQTCAGRMPSYGFRPIRPSSRLLIAEKSLFDQRFFGETVSGITT